MSVTDPAEKAFGSNGATSDRDEQGRFLKGAPGRSPGRPKGSRVKLGEKFFTALQADFEEHGIDAIARVRFLRPDVYMQVIAKLMPQKIEISTPTDGMSDERLAEMLELAERMAAQLQPGDNAKPVTVIEAQPAPSFSIAPPTEAAQRAEAQRLDLHDQHAALVAKLPYPVGRVVPVSDRDAERRNVAKLHDDDINPEDLF